MDSKNELTEEDSLKAESIYKELGKNDSANIEQLDITTYSNIPSAGYSGGVSQQIYNKPDQIKLTDTGSYIVSTGFEESDSPMRSDSGEYAYHPEKIRSNHYLPERE